MESKINFDHQQLLNHEQNENEPLYLNSDQNASNGGNVSYKLVQMPSDDPSPSHVKIMDNVPNQNIKDEPGQSRIIVSGGPDSSEPMYVVMAPENTKQTERSTNLNGEGSSNVRMVHQLDGMGMNTASVSLPNRQKQGKVGGPVKKTPRDDHRRKQHNEVERRRRDKINAWIMRLAKIVPECNEDHTKQGQSKGGILHKTYDYIQQVTKENEDLVKKLNMGGYGGLSHTGDDVNSRLAILEKENRILKTELRHAREDRDDIINQLKAQGIGLTMRPAEEDEYEQQDQNQHSEHVMTQNGDGIVVIGQQ